MSYSIFDSVTNLLDPAETTALADRIGVAPSSVQPGVKAAAATLLEEFAKHASDSEFAVRLFSMAKNFAGLHSAVQATPDTAAASLTDQGSHIAATLLGKYQPAVESAIAYRSGFSLPASHQFLAAVAPLTLRALGERIQEQRFSLFAFSQLIRSEAVKLREQFTAPLSSLRSTPAATETLAFAAERRRPSAFRNIAVLLALLVAFLLTWLLVYGCNKDNAPESSGSAAASVPTAVAPAAPASPLGEFINRKLADGTVLNIPRLGIENRLIDFIEDPSRPVDKATWFDFDRLTFATGSATLQPASAEQLQNVAAILRAYPKVNVKIGGYTDNTGNNAANLKLSDDRAQNVMRELISDGTPASRLDAKGYGEEHPVADNSTEEGRQKNRRISLLVTAK